MSGFSEKCLTWAPHIEQGTMFCFDPSSGSKGSMPGYAVYEAGELVDSGFIQLPIGIALPLRLQALSQALQQEFSVPDVLVTESIYFGMGNKSGVHLQRSIGVIMAALPCERVIEVTPRSWRKHMPPGYTKSDEGDAILMGYTVLAAINSEHAEKLPGRLLDLT